MQNNRNTTTAQERNLGNNIADYRQLIKQHMLSNGLMCPVDLELNGRYQRFSADSNPYKKDEYYIGTIGVTDSNHPYCICTYGSWSTGEKFVFKSFEVDKDQYTPYELRELHKELLRHNREASERMEQEREESQSKVAKEVREYYNLAYFDPPNPRYFEYATKKQINLYHHKDLPIKFVDTDQYPSMMIPLHDIDGKIQSAQYVTMQHPYKKKSFHKGGRTKGLMYMIGDPQSATIFVCEGYATGCSVYEALGRTSCVMVSFTANNVTNIVSQLRACYGKSTIVVCADNDEAGLKVAHEAQQLYKCEVAAPQSENDFNDWACKDGINPVKSYLEKFLEIKKGVREDATTNTGTIMISKNTSKSRFLKINPFNIDDPCANFSINDWPGDLKLYAQNLIDTSPSDPLIIISALLGSISVLLGDRLTYSNTPSDDGENQISLWIFIISESGSFKSKGLRDGSRLIKLHEKEVYKKIAEKKEEKLSSAEELEKEIEKIERLFVRAPVYSSLTARVRFASMHDSCFVLASEASGFLGDLSQKWNGPGKQKLINMFDGEEISDDAVSRKKIVVPRPFFSVVGASTPSFLTQDIDHDDLTTGFLARPLFIRKPDEDPYPEDAQFIVEDNAPINAKLELKIYKVIKDYEKTVMRFSKEAKELGDYIKSKIINAYLRETDPEAKFKSFVIRWIDNIKKLACIFQIFIDDRDSQSSSEVSEEAIAIAYHFVEPCIASTIHLFKKVFVTGDINERVDSVLEYIKEVYNTTGNGVTLRDIKRNRNYLFKNAQPELLTRIIDLLIKQQAIERVLINKRKSVYIPIET